MRAAGDRRRLGCRLRRLCPLPYYLLLVATPEIPFSVQVRYAVGRIHFDDLDDYAAYARSVVAAEAGGFMLDRRVATFAVSNYADSVTQRSAENRAATAEDLVPWARDWSFARFRGGWRQGSFRAVANTGELCSPARVGQCAGATRGQRVAGGVLIVSSIVISLEMTLLPDLAAGIRIGAVIFDVVIGVALVTGHGRFATWALVRVIFGVLATLMTVVIARQNSQANAKVLFEALIHSGFSVALLLLLVGEAGRVRMVLGCALAGAYVALECFGVVALLGGHVHASAL